MWLVCNHSFNIIYKISSETSQANSLQLININVFRLQAMKREVNALVAFWHPAQRSKRKFHTCKEPYSSHLLYKYVEHSKYCSTAKKSLYEIVSKNVNSIHISSITLSNILFFVQLKCKYNFKEVILFLFCYFVTFIFPRT